MCAPCKIILDSYGALQTSANALGQMGEVFCEAIMKGRETGDLTDADVEEAEEFSYKLCDYAKELDAKRWEIINFGIALSEKAKARKKK